MNKLLSACVFSLNAVFALTALNAHATSATNLLLGASVTDSCLSCPIGSYGDPIMITDGSSNTGRNLGTYSGSFNIFPTNAIDLDHISLLPAMTPNGTVVFEIQTSTDPTGAAGTWTSHGGPISRTWSNQTPFNVILNPNTTNVRVVKIIVHSSPSWVAFFEVQGFGASLLSTLLEDNFAGSDLDTGVWKRTSASRGENVVGNSSTVHDGYLDLVMNETDNGGQVVTRFAPQKHLRVTLTHNMHPGNNYFFPSVYLESAVGQTSVNLGWVKSGYATDYCSSAAKFDRVRLVVAQAGNWCDTAVFSSMASSSFYDRWSTAVLDYDMDVGLVTIDLDNNGTIDMQATVPSASRVPATGVGLHGFGWYTGHWQRVDAIKVEGLPLAGTMPLTVTGSGSGTGKINTGEAPAHINCTSTAGSTSGTCSSNEAFNATVTLTATPSPGSTFTGWSGACTNTTGTCKVTMDSAKSVEAGFDLQGPTVGVCGPANGVVVASMPLSGYCNPDTQSVVVTGSGPWTWICSGMNGGAPVNCSAPITNTTVVLSLPPPVSPTITQSDVQGDSYAGFGKRLNVSICAGCAWNASSTVPWITIKTTTGTGPGALDFTVDQFEYPGFGTESRTGNITVNGVTWAVVQTHLHDSDSDGVWDEWELRGVPLGDGVTRMQLPGADPNRKNVWVWIDGMRDLDKNVRLQSTALELVKKAFERNGVIFHAENRTGDPQVGKISPQLASPKNLSDIELMKNAGFYYSHNGQTTKVRDKAWRYVVWGGTFNEGTPSKVSPAGGIGWPDIAFIAAESGCTAGGNCLWGLGGLSTTINQAGTLLHELGHVLGLGHGGPWSQAGAQGDVNGLTTDYKYKPNHISVMNYAYQLSGLETNRAEEYKIDFQVRQRPTIDENDLSSFWEIPVAYETNGSVARDGDYGVTLLCVLNNSTNFQDSPEPKDIDSVWESTNWLGVKSRESFNPGETANCGALSTPKTADLDGNGQLNRIPSAREWKHLNFREGNLVGSLGDSTVIDETNSHFFPEAPLNAIARPLTYEHAVMIYGEPAKKAMPSETVQFAFYVENRGFVTDSYDLAVFSSNGWPVSGFPSGITVGPSGKQWVSFTVAVPAGATIGSHDDLVVSATSVGKTNNSDSKGFIVEVDAAETSSPMVPPVETTTVSVFAFSPVAYAAATTLVESGNVILQGFNVPISLRVRYGEAAVNGGGWTSDAQTVNSGDSVRLRVLSSPVAGAISEAEVAVGGVVTQFRVTTAPVYSFTMSANPTASGTVTCVPNPVSHGGSASCVATANAGYTFVGWSGDCMGMSCSLSNVTANKSVTANFAPVASYTGPLPGGGNASISVAGAGCMLASAQFITAPAGTPAGTSFPHGLADFSVIGCVGGTATVTVTYPTAIPAGAKYWKEVGGVYSEYPATISTYGATFTLTDNGAGDSDPANGVIHDPSGIGAPMGNGNAEAIPTLAQWALMLLAGLILMVGWQRVQRHDGFVNTRD